MPRLLHGCVSLGLEFGESVRSERVLEGKRALITGANRGIGLAVAGLFAAHGAEVIACVRTDNADLATLIANKEGVDASRIRVLNLDLEDVDSIKLASNVLIAEGRKLDVVVNNAGYAMGSRFNLTSRGELQRSLQINFVGPMLLTQRLLRIMGSTNSNQTASIINISSSAVSFPNIGMAAYSASKAAMEQSSRILAKEVAPIKIRVNVISPGPIDTEMLRLMNDESRRELIGATWMKRIGTADEVASVALFLASDLSNYITGQVIHVNGGLG